MPAVVLPTGVSEFKRVMQDRDSDKWIARPTQCRALLQARSDKIRVGFGQVARWQMGTSYQQWKLPTQVCNLLSSVCARCPCRCRRAPVSELGCLTHGLLPNKCCDRIPRARSFTLMLRSTRRAVQVVVALILLSKSHAVHYPRCR